MAKHVIVGAGPVGTGTALALAERGDEVVVVTRSGSGPNHAGVRLKRADAADVAEMTAVTAGAWSIVNCANPPYHRWVEDWPPIHRSLMQAAEQSGAVLAMIDNLYAFGPATPMPMRENTPMRATGAKGGMRAMMAQDLL
jgi:glycine/D-amino acid oxidase-like deaminating enzyme